MEKAQTKNQLSFNEKQAKTPKINKNPKDVTKSRIFFN